MKLSKIYIRFCDEIETKLNEGFICLAGADVWCSLRLSGFYQAAYGDWLVKLGASIEHGKVDDTDSKTDVLVFTEIKYRLN